VEAESRGKSINITASVKDDSNPSCPLILLKYSYVAGEGVIRLRLPEKHEFDAFTGIRLLIDGKAAKHVDPKAVEDDVAYSRIVDMVPGKSTEVEIPLDRTFVVPKNWRTLEIIPTRSHVPCGGYTVGLKITNEMPE
jgi:hypothetical protein